MSKQLNNPQRTNKSEGDATQAGSFEQFASESLNRERENIKPDPEVAARLHTRLFPPKRRNQQTVWAGLLQLFYAQIPAYQVALALMVITGSWWFVQANWGTAPIEPKVVYVYQTDTLYRDVPSVIQQPLPAPNRTPKISRKKSTNKPSRTLKRSDDGKAIFASRQEMADYPQTQPDLASLTSNRISGRSVREDSALNQFFVPAY